MRRALIGTLAIALGSSCAARRPPTGPPPVGAIEEGVASWYGLEERGRRTASGEAMEPEARTAAHPRHPFGTLLRVTDLETRRSVIVVVNDRGPSVRGRVVDLSHGAARELGMVEKGLARVRVEVVGVDPGRLNTRWAVQVGSFLLEGKAKELAQEIERSGHRPVAVSPYPDRERVYYRVQVGSFLERAEAERLAVRLRREGRETVIVQVEQR
jgi:rare lipoprotein A